MQAYSSENFSRIIFNSADLVRIESGMPNNITINITNITTINCDSLAYVSYNSAKGTFTGQLNPSNYSCSGNILTVCLTLEPTDATNKNILYMNRVTVQGGGTNTYADLNPDYYICNKTFFYLKTHQKEDFNELDILVNQMSLEGHNYTLTNVYDFIINWQDTCSILINRTLKEDLVCRKLYYLIIGNSNYTFNDLMQLRDTLTNEVIISPSLIKLYADNYEEKCEKITKLALPFNRKPEISLLSMLPVLNISLYEPPNCSLLFNKTILDSYMPFFNIFQGADMSCRKIDSMRWLFRIEKYSDGYYIIGIKFLVLIVTMIILFSSYFVIILKNLKKKLNTLPDIKL